MLLFTPTHIPKSEFILMKGSDSHSLISSPITSLVCKVSKVKIVNKFNKVNMVILLNIINIVKIVMNKLGLSCAKLSTA